MTRKLSSSLLPLYSAKWELIQERGVPNPPLVPSTISRLLRHVQWTRWCYSYDARHHRACKAEKRAGEGKERKQLWRQRLPNLTQDRPCHRLMIIIIIIIKIIIIIMMIIIIILIIIIIIIIIWRWQGLS